MSDVNVDDGLYRIVVLGGGPAGIGIFIRAARTGFLPRLLHPELFGTDIDVACSTTLGMKQKGAAIVHDGDASTFGSGNLGKYIINSNTFARSLLSSVLDEKPELDPPESIRNTFLALAKAHESTKRLEDLGCAPACLVDFGRFLQNVGACLMDELTQPQNALRNKCMLNTQALRFEQQASGIYRIEVLEKANGRVMTLFAENIVLAMGGVQSLPPTLQNNPLYTNKLFLSDECLRDDGFKKLRDHLQHCDSEKRKVCLVGGSHSSFSVAWLLLNKQKQRKKSATSSAATSSPGMSATSTTSTIMEPDTSSAEVTGSCSPGKLALSSELPAKTDPNPSTFEQPAQNQEAPYPSPLRPLNIQTIQPSFIKKPELTFQPKDITILHRNPIRCYYATRKEAESDGADGSRVDRTGCVNTFTGLREDAKNLFRDIKNRKENRLRLFQVNANGCQNLTTKAYESASAIVWCCGYATRMIPAFDANGNQFQFKMDNGVVQLDLKARVHVLQSSKAFVPVKTLFGVGLGFSLRSHVDEMGTETRADGVTVYHRRGATLVLAALFGSEVFGVGSQSFEEMIEKNDAKKKKDKAQMTVDTQLDKLKRSTLSGTIEVAATAPPKPTLSNVVPVPLGLVGPEKLGIRSRVRIKPLEPEESAAVAELSNHNTATNPPIKLLLQRRRSSEALCTKPTQPISRSVGKNMSLTTDRQ